MCEQNSKILKRAVKLYPSNMQSNQIKDVFFYQRNQSNWYFTENSI